MCVCVGKIGFQTQELFRASLALTKGELVIWVLVVWDHGSIKGSFRVQSRNTRGHEIKFQSTLPMNRYR